MIRHALSLLPYAPRFIRPWIIGLVLGRKPERLTQEETDRLEAKRRNAMVNKALEGNK